MNNIWLYLQWLFVVVSYRIIYLVLLVYVFANVVRILFLLLIMIFFWYFNLHLLSPFSISFFFTSFLFLLFDFLGTALKGGSVFLMLVLFEGDISFVLLFMCGEELLWVSFVVCDFFIINVMLLSLLPIFFTSN